MQTTDAIVSDTREAAGLISGGNIAALSLVCANLGLLTLYFLLQLTLFELVFIYWWEILWIGLFSALKLLTAAIFGSPLENRWVHFSRGSTLFLTLVSIAKCAALFLGLLALTGIGLLAVNQAVSGIPAEQIAAGKVELILRCSLIFFIGHGLSFIVNFLLLGEFRRARFGTLLWLPFRRSLALIVVVALLIATIQSRPDLLTETSVAALLIAIKLGWDYVLHRQERRSLSAGGQA